NGLDPSGIVPGIRIPIRGTVLRSCAVTVSGAASRLRVSGTMNPTAWHHIIFSLHCLYTHLVLAICMKPNASLQLLPEAAAQRRLEAVSGKALFGAISASMSS